MFYRYALVSLLERLILRIMKLLKIKFHKKQIYTTPNMDYTSSQVTNLPLNMDYTPSQVTNLPPNMDYTSSQITNLPPNKNKLLEVILVSQYKSLVFFELVMLFLAHSFFFKFNSTNTIFIYLFFSK